MRRGPVRGHVPVPSHWIVPGEDRRRSDVDRDRRRSAREAPVGDAVGEGIRAAETRLRGVGEGAIAIADHGAIRRLREVEQAERVAIEVAVIREHIARSHRERLRGREGAVVLRSRRIGRGANRDND